MWRSEHMTQILFRAIEECPICLQPNNVTRHSDARNCWRCSNGRNIHAACFAKLTKCPFCRASFLNRYIQIYFIHDDISDREIDHLRKILKDITKETNWEVDESIYEEWGSILLTGSPQHGENIAENCRSKIRIASLKNMWISLIDDINHAPINAQEIMDTFRTKNINVYPMIDEDEFLDMPRAGKIF